MAHNHDHSKQPGNIKLAFFLNLGFTIFEFIGGFYVNSIAIVSDALHDMGDSLSLGLSWYLDKKSKKTGSKKYTFGYQRFSLLGALINSVVLILGSSYVIYEAVQRLSNPEHTDARGMLIFAIVGVIVNGIAAFKLSKGKSLNERVLQWHLLEDVLGWTAVLIVSIVLMFKDIHILDPLLSLGITVYILWNVIKRLIETMKIFLQGAPEKINIDEIEQKFKALPYVSSVHHTHIWSLDGEHHVLTSHIKLNQMNSIEEVLKIKNEIKKVVEAYDLEHVTIETEFDKEECGNLISEKTKG
jgi:cobalt-zinc-cadmium efflux system protein